jgi:hypothetical protein
VSLCGLCQEVKSAKIYWREFKQAKVIQNHKNANVLNNGQGEAGHRKYKRLKLGGGQSYDRSSD